MKTNFCISINDVVPGMILNENILKDGNLLLPKGAVIKPAYISQLAARGVSFVNVCAERSHYKDIIRNPVERFYAEAYEDIASIVDVTKEGSFPESSQIYLVVEKVLDKVFTNRSAILLLTGLRGKCDYYYAHSLDVCIYSLIAAKAIGMNYEDTVILGTGALLHDIGKTKIPDEILLKQGSLTDAELREVQRHPEHGFRMAVKAFGMKHPVSKIILQHHERCDGSGYPLKLKKEEILFFSQIVAVADIYDALVSDKVYRKKILPHEAAEYLLCMSNLSLNGDITGIFLKNISIYPRGCQVLLNTKEVAVVLDSNPKMSLRPLLRIITDSDRNMLAHPFEFDLETHPGVFIVDMFN